MLIVGIATCLGRLDTVVKYLDSNIDLLYLAVSWLDAGLLLLLCVYRGVVWLGLAGTVCYILLFKFV